MFKQVRILSLLIFPCLLALQSCENDAPQKETKKTSTEKLISKEEITNFIADFYHQQYKQHQIEKSTTDSTLEISYLGTLPNDTIESWLIAIYIPTNASSTDILSGDLTNDNEPELLVKVKTEGGGVGANSASFDYFLFVGQASAYRFQAVYSSSTLSGCDDNYGLFLAEKIAQQKLWGTSMCYAEDDGHCCPSLHYQTTIGMSNDSLQILSRVSKDQPSESL